MRSIDVHAHLTPQCFWQATEKGGDWHTVRREKDERGQEVAIVGGRRQTLPPRAKWTPEERLADMDSLGVDVHVVSPYVGFYNYQLDTKVATATARATNDEISSMTRAWPKRFAGLGALVFFHQGGETLVSPRTKRYHLPNTVGNLVDRAVTFATLVSGGVMDECPDLKIVLGHGGGYTCYGIGRMDHGWKVRSEARVNITQPPSAYLRRFYYDCIVYTESALRFLIDTVGAERVVFGTDWPYDMALDWPVSWILAMESLTQEEKEAILWRNLERLLDL